jgi:hypothetical protein
MRLEFGSYVQVFEANDPTNTPKARSLGAITLTPSGNITGDYYFLSLATGACISRHQWTSLPMPDTAIARVEALAKQEGQPLIQERGLVVEWRPDHPIDDDEYDRDYEPPDTDPSDDFDPVDYDPFTPDELADLAEPPDAFPFDNFGLPPPPGAVQGATYDPNDPNDQNDQIDPLNHDPEPDPNFDNQHACHH